MTEKPLVSVIINCYNSEKYLRETIDSLIAQTYDNWEAIFWDNCSTDKTAEIIASYNEPRFRYFLAEKNTPLGEARNRAMERINGVYFCFLDSDDSWTKDFLRIGITSLIDKNQGCVGFYCNFYNWYDGITVSENNKGWCSGVHGLDYVVKKYGIAMSGAICETEIARKNDIHFNQNYQLVEDMDFFLQFLAFGNFIYVCQPLTYYRVYTSSTTFKLKSRWAYEYSDLYNRFYSKFVKTDNPRLTEDDLSYIKTQELSCQAEDLIAHNKRRELSVFLFKNRKYLPFRYCWSRIVYVLTGSWGYSLIGKIKKLVR